MTTWSCLAEVERVAADRHPRLLSWWKDDPRDPGRPRADDPDVLHLDNQLAPGSSAHDLGGVMSLNLRLDPKRLALREHQPFVSRARQLALHQVRSLLAETGPIVPVALEMVDKSPFRCRDRWAELESFIPHTRLPPSFDSYQWLFEQVGILHRGLASIEPAPPRPPVATYATPHSLRRWLGVTNGRGPRRSRSCGDRGPCSRPSSAPRTRLDSVGAAPGPAHPRRSATEQHLCDS